MIFGRNLRALAANEESISGLCARLEINRTQFNRYLNGETFPRPDILHRICAYFEVDARILLEPVDAWKADGSAALVKAASELLLAGNDFNVDHARLPDGLYRFWRNSFNWPDKVLVSMCRIFTRDGVKLFKAFELPNPLHSEATRVAHVQNAYHGIFLQHEDGVSLYCTSNSSRMLSIAFYEYGLAGWSDYLAGLSFLTRRSIPGMRRRSINVLERLAPSCPVYLAAARECGLRDSETVPGLIRNRLATMPSDH